MKLGKLIVFIVLLGGVVAGYAIFKNPLINSGIERGLEQVFGAKAEVRGVRFDPIKGQISFSHLKVADKAHPFFNLFEMGVSRVSLDTWEMLKGKVVIHEMECQNIMWNTPRKTSGVLEKKKANKLKKNKISKQNKSSGNSANKKLGEEKKGLDIDVSSVLESELTNLKTPILVSNLTQSLESINNRWTTRVAKTKTDVKGLEKNVNSLRSVNVSRITTVQQAIELKGRIDNTLKTVNNLKKETSTVVSDIQNDSKTIKKMPDQIQKSINGDFQYLKSRINIPQGGTKGLVASLVRPYLSAHLGKMSHYVFLATDLALKNSRSGKSTKKKKNKDVNIKDTRHGSVISFPTRKYPSFLLENLKISVKDQKSGLEIAGSLKNISSNPNLWNKPSLFNYRQKSKSLNLAVQGSLDVRSNSQNLLTSRIQIKQIPFELTEGLNLVQAKSIEGQAGIDWRFDMKPKGDLSGLVEITTTKLKTTMFDNPDLVGQIFADTLGSVSRAVVKVAWQVSADGKTQFEADSNLDELLSKKVGESLRKLAAKMEKDLQTELNSKLAPSLKENKDLQGVFNTLQGDASWSKNKVDSYDKQLKKKKQEVENRINAIKQKTANKVNKQVNTQVQKATKNIKIPKGLGF